MSLKLKPRLFLKTSLLFGSTQFLGLYVAAKLLPDAAEVGIGQIRDFSVTDFLILLAITAIFIVSFRFPRLSGWVYRVFLTVLIFSMAQLILSLWLDPLAALATALASTLIFWLFHNVFVQNLVMVLTLAGAGAALGLALTPGIAITALVLLSVYDVIAVYRTGHMIKMAQAMIQSQAIFGFVVPDVPGGLGRNIAEVTPGENYMILGSGDVALPLVLAVSLVRFSLAQSLVVAGFAILGLFLMHLIFINQKVRRPMAALPPIAGLAIIGYLIASL